MGGFMQTGRRWKNMTEWDVQLSPSEFEHLEEQEELEASEDSVIYEELSESAPKRFTEKEAIKEGMVL